MKKNFILKNIVLNYVVKQVTISHGCNQKLHCNASMFLKLVYKLKKESKYSLEDKFLHGIENYFFPTCT